MANPEEMHQCQTTNCGYIYNPDKGDRKGKIKPGTRFEDLPDDWRCPVCGGSKKCFRPLAGPGSTREAKCEMPTAAVDMRPYSCNTCGFEYEPARGEPRRGTPAGTAFQDLPEEWRCPVCRSGKTNFAPEQQPEPTRSHDMKYICNICGYVYDPAVGDPDNGVKPGTKFEDLPDSWTCPICGAPKDSFSPEEA